MAGDRVRAMGRSAGFETGEGRLDAEIQKDGVGVRRGRRQRCVGNVE